MNVSCCRVPGQGAESAMRRDGSVLSCTESFQTEPRLKQTSA